MLGIIRCRRPELTMRSTSRKSEREMPAFRRGSTSNRVPLFPDGEGPGIVRGRNLETATLF